MNNRFKLAVIGTNFIVPTFIEASVQSGHFELHSILSRKIKSGETFRRDNHYEGNVVVHTNIDEMLNDDALDAVYIASPNAVHFSQASACIEAGKAVMVEKPMCSNSRELSALIALAKAKNVLLMDGMKSLVCPNFNTLVGNLPRLGRIRQCTATYSKVSSRYQDYLDGRNPNTFNPHFSNGSVMDLGVYCLYPFVQLFDTPKAIHGFADLLDSGVDAAGTIILTYPDFHVSITHSKVCASFNSTEIQGEDGSIIINNVSTLNKMTFIDKEGSSSDISVQQNANSLFYIAQHFGETLSSGLTESLVNTNKLSAKVMKLLDDVRAQTGVHYPADAQ